MGRVGDADFQRAARCAEHLAGPAAAVKGLLPADFEEHARGVLAGLRERGLGLDHRGGALALARPAGGGAPEYLGNADEFLKWARERFLYEDGSHEVVYQRMAKKGMRAALKATGHSFLSLSFAVEGHPAGRIVIELFESVCPATCANFKALALGGGAEGEEKLHSYVGTPVHRVVREGWFQAGDVGGGKGTGGTGTAFADETFKVKHDRPGILGMCSAGRHSASSQFYVTLQAQSWLDGRSVAFGRVVDGMRTVKYIGKLPCQNERPVPECVISEAEVFDL